MVSKVETNPADFADWFALHALLTGAFAGMAGRIDPPSSMTRLTVADLPVKADVEDLFLIRVPAPDATPIACLFGHAKPDHYYIGKLAVAAPQRGQGLARLLVEAAAAHARTLSLPALELETRVELTENHATFARLGFTEVARTAHPGYSHPTTLRLRRVL